MKTGVYVVAGAVVALAVAVALPAQTLVPLHSFTGGDDGSDPQPMLVLSGTNLYGTAQDGGLYGYGTVFRMSTDGSTFTNLYNFTDGMDGAYPVGGLILSGTNLYGVANAAGSGSAGTVFRVSTNGVFALLHGFVGNDGANPEAGLVLSGMNLYGTTYDGGTFGCGNIFLVNVDGTTFSNIYNFTGNGDGGNPEGALVCAGTNLYGTAAFGGNPGAGYGTVFKIGASGGGFAALHIFTNSDGANPATGLVLSDGVLYGAASDGGSNTTGTLFALGTNGAGFTVLHTFSPETTGSTGGLSTNYDGTFPRGLILSGANLLGVAQFGGLAGSGTVFSLGTNGAGFATLYTFTNGLDGAEPAGLLAAGSSAYGVAEFGGSAGAGTLFVLSLSPPVPLITGAVLSDGNLIITASAENPGTYELLTSTNLLLPLNQWIPVTTNVLATGGNVELTNAVSRASSKRFYILQAR